MPGGMTRGSEVLRGRSWLGTNLRNGTLEICKTLMILALPLPGQFSLPGRSKWSFPLGILTSRPRSDIMSAFFRLEASSHKPSSSELWQWPSCPGPVLPLATLTRICSGIALKLDRRSWPFLSVGQLCQDLCPTQTHQPHQPVHMAAPSCLFLGQSLIHKGWRKRSPLLPEPSPGHHNASPNDVFITPSCTLGMLKSLVSEWGVWLCLFKHCSSPT
ncbi:unnamed protein product [Leuciscus chuanchicus]